MDGRGVGWSHFGGFKKKVLERVDQRHQQPHQRFQSIFSAGNLDPERGRSSFVPPETLGMASELESGQRLSNGWDVAIRYHELKTKVSTRQEAQHLRKISAQAILERAREVLGAVVHPVEPRVSPWSELEGHALRADLDIEETVENSPVPIAGALGLIHASFPLTAADVWMGYSMPRIQPLVISVDTSLSMTGEKLALTAVALGVVLLEFPDDPIGIVAFENEARVLKYPEKRISIQDLVERFLDVPAQGYTHLEDGLKAALVLVKTSRRGGQARLPSTVLLTDGKYTAGKDPSYLAQRFPHLVVLKMGKERASLQLCKELARKGNGALREILKLDSLPAAMYGVVKDLLRGRSMS